jgi:hypothetical protein
MKFMSNMRKFYIFFIECFIHFNFIYSSKNSYYLENESHNSSRLKFKLQTQNLLENMYSNVNYKTYCEDKMISLQETQNKNFIPENQFAYMDYDRIVSELTALSQEFPRFLKLSTGQKEFNLPHPSGQCGKGR